MGGYKLLVLERDPQRADQIIRTLMKQKPQPDIRTVTADKALAPALGEKPDLILSAWTLPGGSCLDVLRILKEKELAIPLIIVTDEGDESRAVEALKNGAADYLAMDQLAQLNRAVAEALEKAEEQRRRKNLERGMQFTQFAYERAAIGIYWLNEAGRFLLVNETGALATGYAQAELHQLAIADLDVNLTPQAWTTLLTQLRSKPSVSFESVHRHKQGGLMAVEISANLFHWDGEDYILLFSRDITRRKKADEEFRRMQRQVQHGKKMEALGRLAGGMAHEFNNMLMVIQNSAEFIAMDAKGDKTLQDYADQIMRTSKRAAALTSQLLAFSRKQQFELKVLDLNAALLDMIKWLRRLVRENVSLTADIHGSIGNIRIAPGELGQMVINLVMNAGDAMPAGGDLILSTRPIVLDKAYCMKQVGARPGRYLMLSVQDTGQGMDQETCSHIFEPFYTTKESGTGLGLSIVFGIVQQNGGHIECISQKGKGTLFRLYLPQFDGPESEPGGAIHYDTLPRGSETILLVEDEPDVRISGMRTLEKQGYKVLCAQNGIEALALLEATPEPIHLLITDVIMPLLSGAELAKKVLKRRKGIKVLYTSAYPDGIIFSQHDVDVTSAFFIGKPFTIEEIAKKVRQVLDSRPRASA